MAAEIEANLNTILSILPTEDAEKVRDCYATGKTLSPKKKRQHYEQTVANLVEEDSKRNLIYACYALVFDLEGHHCGKRFKIQEHRKRLASLVTITRRWGSEIVQHYDFSSKGRSYLDQLRRIAARHNWQEAVVLFNISIDQKSHKHKRSREVENCVNTITDWVLKFATHYDGQIENPSALPHGCGRDRYGLIVRNKFVKELTPSPLPSSQTPNHYDGSTLIPALSSKAQTIVKSIEPISPILTHDNTNLSTSNVREQITTISQQSSSCLPVTPSSQPSPLSPAPQLVDNGDVAMGDNGREYMYSPANGPTAVSPAQSAGDNVIHSLRLSTSLPPSTLQSSPSSLSNTEIPFEANTATAISSSPPPPYLEANSTASASQNNDYDGVCIGDHNTPAARNPTITIASLLSPSSPLLTPPRSTPIPRPLSTYRASSLPEEPEDFSSQDGNMCTIHPAAVPYSCSAGPPLSPASLSQMMTIENDKSLTVETINTNFGPPSPLLVAPSTLKPAWLSDLPSSLHRLDEKGWLNDTIINGYMRLLTKHHDVCYISSYFFERFNPNIKWRFEHGNCPLESEFVLMPINENSHWYLMFMYKRYFPATNQHELVVCFLDSLGPSMHSNSFKHWTEYLKACGDGWTVQQKHVQVPQQQNTSGCGVYVLGFAEKILQDIQGFVEAIDGGDDLGWEFDEQILRKHIRDNLNLALDAEELIGKIARLQARGSPLADKLETLKYNEFLEGLILPPLQQKLKTPQHGVATGIEPPISISEASPLIIGMASPENVDTADAKDMEGSSSVQLLTMIHNPGADQTGRRDAIDDSCKPENLATGESYKPTDDLSMVHHSLSAQVPGQVNPALTAMLASTAPSHLSQTSQPPCMGTSSQTSWLPSVSSQCETLSEASRTCASPSPRLVASSSAHDLTLHERTRANFIPHVHEDDIMDMGSDYSDDQGFSLSASTPAAIRYSEKFLDYGYGGGEYGINFNPNSNAASLGESYMRDALPPNVGNGESTISYANELSTSYLNIQPADKVSKPAEGGLVALINAILHHENVDLQTINRILEWAYHSQQYLVEKRDMTPGLESLCLEQISDITPSHGRKRKRGSDRDEYGYSQSGLATKPKSRSLTDASSSEPSQLTPPSAPLSFPTVISKTPGNTFARKSMIQKSKILPVAFIDDSVPLFTSSDYLLKTIDDSAWQSYNIPSPGLQLQLSIRVPDTALSIKFAMNGNTHGLKYLFDRGLASPRDVSDSRGFGLIRWSLYGGMHQYETVQFLLSQSAHVDEDSYEHVWDFRLRKKCSEKEVEALRCITENQNRNWVEDQQFTSLHMIILGLSPKQLAEELAENPSAVYAKDALGRTALDWATARAQLNDMSLLINRGSNPNTMDKRGRTTVLHAVDSHDEKALQIILAAGGNPNPKMPEGLYRSSPLTSATFGGLTGMVRLLLHYGADIDACNPEGRTALHTVAGMPNAECANTLLEHGAKINQMSKNGHTPLTTAIVTNNHMVLKLFVDRYCISGLDGAQLLHIIAESADMETMSILGTSYMLRQCLNTSKDSVAVSTKTLKCRTDYNEELAWAFEGFCSADLTPWTTLRTGG